MQTPRDVGADHRTGTRSVRNSSTAMTHVMGVGTAGGLTVVPTFSAAIAATVIATQTGGHAYVEIATAIGSTIGPGVIAGKPSSFTSSTDYTCSVN